MKILGVGVDIIDNNRIKTLIRKKNFSKKKNSRIAFFAKRFAAKESFSKSIGTGIRNNLIFKDIEILNDKFGKPYFRKTKKINNLIYKKFKVKKYNLFLSISDEKEYSIAFTILQKK